MAVTDPNNWSAMMKIMYIDPIDGKMKSTDYRPDGAVVAVPAKEKPVTLTGFQSSGPATTMKTYQYEQVNLPLTVDQLHGRELTVPAHRGALGKLLDPSSGWVGFENFCVPVFDSMPPAKQQCKWQGKFIQHLDVNYKMPIGEAAASEQLRQIHLDKQRDETVAGLKRTLKEWPTCPEGKVDVVRLAWQLEWSCTCGK